MKKSEELINVIEAMRSYIHKSDHNFHNCLEMAYCNGCRSITEIGGDYTVHAGTDCGGDHYETKHSPEMCVLCRSPNFIKISLHNFEKLYETYRGRTSDILIEGIKNSLEKMDFPSLYNENLPKIANKWKKLNMDEKKKQVRGLLNLNKQISRAKKELESLEGIIYGERETGEDEE